jgi:uncharacterized protein
MTLNLPLLFAACAAVGVLSSLIGVGGGILLVPIFTLIFKMPLIQALALSLCCVLATSVTSSAKYLSTGLVDIRTALNLEITTLIFSYFGGKAVSWISTKVLAFTFAVVLVASAVALLKPQREKAESRIPPRLRYPLAIAASTLARSMVGLLGIGGGIVLVPVLRFSLRKTIKEAVATSTFMLGTSAAVALIPYVHRGNVPFAVAPFAALGTISGAFVGSRLFHRIESVYIKVIFAAAMLYTAYSMVMKGLSQ